MHRPWLKIVVWGGVVAVGVASAIWLRAWRSEVATATLARHEAHLADPDPRVRLAAAEGVLGYEPDRDRVRLIRAKTLMRLGRHGPARKELKYLRDRMSPADQVDVMTLLADSYLSQAAHVVAEGSQEAVDMTTDHAEPLLAEAEGIVELLRDAAASQQAVVVFQARVVSIRAGLLRLMLTGQVLELAKAEAATMDEQAEVSSVRVIKLQNKLDGLQDQLAQLCSRAIVMDPVDPQPKQLLFEARLNAKQFDQARRMAQTLSRESRISAALAGRMADTLLSLEREYSLEVTDDDRRTAAALLNHPNLYGTQDIHYRIAVLHLALDQHRYEEAEARARRLLARYKSHPRIATLLAWSLIGQGKAQEATRFLYPYQRRLRSARVRHVLGAALLASNEPERARELLRQSLEMEPRNLPARIMLAQSLVDAGFVVEAEDDITAAMSLNDKHPRVLALRARLMVEKIDRLGLIDLLEQGWSQERSEPGWRDVALAAAMVLDDTQRVSTLVRQWLSRKHTDATAWVGDGWLRTEAANRHDVAAVVVRAVLCRMDADPLLIATPPEVAVLNSPPGQAATPPEDGVFPLRSFVSRPIESAWDLVDLAKRRWPEQPELLDVSAQLSLWTGRREQAVRDIQALSRSGEPLAATIRDIQAFLGLATPGLPSHTGIKTEGIATGHGGAEDRLLSPTQQWVALASALKRGDSQIAQEALLELIGEHLWAEAAVHLAVRDAIERGSLQQVEGLLSAVHEVNQGLADLVRSQYSLWRGKSTEALRLARLLVKDEPRGSELRRRASEVIARAYVANSQVTSAVGVFENMALSADDQRLVMRIAAIDVLIDSDRIAEAAGALGILLAVSDTPPRWVDRLLARAVVVMEPSRLLSFVNGMLQFYKDNPLLLLYKAQCLDRIGQADEARHWVEEVLRSRPNAPRAQTVWVQIAGADGKTQSDAKPPARDSRVDQPGHVMSPGVVEPATEPVGGVYPMVVTEGATP